MSLVIKDDRIEKNELNVIANGGTEMMQRALASRLPEDLLSSFQIIPSRVRKIESDKIPLLWCHDTFNDPESQHLKDPASRARFRKIIFVSNYQFMTYHYGLGVPHSDAVVLKNAIVPIEKLDKTGKDDGPIRLIYHTTPHRGLEILVPVFEHLYDIFNENIVLDVYSSFKAYGWDSRDLEYKELFDKCKEHPGINYHGYQPNDVVREALSKAHIFAYPNIWTETSCISLMEAMSAGCAIVCPNLGALPETGANFPLMYPMHENNQEHANIFAAVLRQVIEKFWTDSIQSRVSFQKDYADSFYTWDVREYEWKNLLTDLKQ